MDVQLGTGQLWRKMVVGKYEVWTLDSVEDNIGKGTPRHEFVERNCPGLAKFRTNMDIVLGEGRRTLFSNDAWCKGEAICSTFP